MVSKLAKEDIEQLIADGLMPSVNDVVKLNALGLAVEKSSTSAEQLFYMPRTAYLGDVVLRQPTLGHEIWLDEVAQIMDMGDEMTNLAVTAYACSVFDSDDLPKPSKKIKIVTELVKFKHSIRKFTIQQIVAATRYVCDGNDAELYEYPISQDKGVQLPKEVVSIPVGILLDGISIGLPITLGEAKRMTQSKYQFIVKRFMKSHGMTNDKYSKEDAKGDYFVTLHAIKERLEREKQTRTQAENG